MALMPILTGTLNTYLKTIDTPYLTVRFDKAEDTCWLRPCLQIKNLYIRLLDKEFHGGTVAVEVPYKWPMSVEIKSLESQPSDITINAMLNEDTLNVQKLKLKSADLTADLNGWYNTNTHQFSADMNTQNLANFLKPYIPQNMEFISSLFLSNGPQNLKLAENDGWLTIGGFPVFPLDINALSGFLNSTKNGANFDTFVPPSPNLNLNELDTLFNSMFK